MLNFRSNLKSLYGIWVAALTVTRTMACLPPHAQELLSESMAWMDIHYDADVGYLYFPGGSSALRHDPRSSVWYSLGLLARNRDDDVVQAERIIDNIVGIQYTNASEQWYNFSFCH